MRRIHWSVLGMLALVAGPLAAQQGLAPEAQKESDTLRALVKAVPVIPANVIELHPPIKLEGISAVQADGQGNIYILHRPTLPDSHPDPVVILDQQGKLIRSFGKGMYRIPHGIRIDPEGNLWTTDANTSMIYKFTARGGKLLEIEVGGIPDRNADFCSITDVAFSPTGNGHIFVSDGYCNGRVVEYDAAGRKVNEFGSRGSGPGQFMNAHGIAIGPDRNIYVADRENGRIQWFDLTGKFLGERKYGGQLYNVTFDSKGELWAAVHPKGVSLDEEFSVVHFDNATGAMRGRVDGRCHQLGIGIDGSIYPATRSERLVVIKPRK